MTTFDEEALVAVNEPDDVLLGQVLAYYQDTLVRTPKALDYLQSRALRDPELLAHFRLGFCDRTLGTRIPVRQLKSGRLIRAQLTRIGILKDTGHELLRGSIVVPLKDIKGQRIVQVYGRKMGRQSRKGTPDHVWLHEGNNGTGILNIEGFVPRQKVILTYGIIDALTLWSAGFRNVTSTLFQTTLTDDLKALLADRSIKGVTLALPRSVDANAIVEALIDLGIEVHQAVLPKGSDLNDIACQADDPHAALQALLRAANWLCGPGRPPRKEPPSEATQTPASGTPQKEPQPADEDHQVVIEHGDRRWRIRGLENNTSHGTMRVNILVSRGEAAAYHVDVIELYSARHRRGFIKAAADELDLDEKTIKSDLGKVLLHLEEVQDERIRQALEPATATAVEMSDEDEQAALRYLRQPDLLDRIQADFDALGLVGEKMNKAVAYLAATSRKLRNPLAVVIQSSSAAGKSTLMEAVLRLIPDEDKLTFSAMTGRSLYYLGEQDLAHRVLAIAEEEGATDAAYALKILQSEGRLKIASTGKESKTGRLTTQTYEVTGPVALLLTTTAIDIDEELMNRCIVLTVDEGRTQTKAIHEAQRRRKTLDGLLEAARHDALVHLHHNVQRLLRPLHVVIPQADRITYADHALRARRDHQKFLTLIQAVALLHQHQRDVKEADLDGLRIKYIEATDADVDTASGLAHEALGCSLDDLPPGTRSLLVALHGYVTAKAEEQGIDQADLRFTRREAREHLKMGDTQMKVHLRRLVDLEFLVVHRGGDGGGRRIAYELVYQGEGQDGGRFLPGLRSSTTTQSGRGSRPHRSGSGRPSVGPRSGGGRGAEITSNSAADNASSRIEPADPPERSIGPSKTKPAEGSY